MNSVIPNGITVKNLAREDAFLRENFSLSIEMTHCQHRNVCKSEKKVFVSEHALSSCG